MNKKFIAFTLSEILITCSVLGFIVIATFISTFRMSDIRRKEAQISSQAFYSQVENVFAAFVNKELRESGETMETITGGDDGNPALRLVNYFLESMDGVIDTSCIGAGSVQYAAARGSRTYIVGPKCAKFVSSGIRMAVWIDSSCSIGSSDSGIDVYEYWPQDSRTGASARQVNNACGIITYRLKHYDPAHTAPEGTDFFSIALGKVRVK